eukprot:SM000029S10593  [mRNA]  locus=s29:822425:823161:- [translate_table: standard]
MQCRGHLQSVAAVWPTLTNFSRLTYGSSDAEPWSTLNWACGGPLGRQRGASRSRALTTAARPVGEALSAHIHCGDGGRGFKAATATATWLAVVPHCCRQAPSMPPAALDDDGAEARAAEAYRRGRHGPKLEYLVPLVYAPILPLSDHLDLDA